MTTHSTSTFATATSQARAGLELIPVRDRLWRVARVGGAVLGHIEAVAESSGERYQARRLISGGISTLDLGTFWRAEDAMDCFRS